MWDLQELSGCYSVKQVEEKSTFNKPDSSLFVCFFSYTVVSFCDSYIENKSERQCVYKVCCHLAFIHWNWTWAQSAGHHICIKPWWINLMFWCIWKTKKCFFPHYCWSWNVDEKKNVTVQSTRRKLHEVIQPVSTSTFLNIAQVWFATQENMDSCNREAIKKQHK